MYCHMHTHYINTSLSRLDGPKALCPRPDIKSLPNDSRSLEQITSTWPIKWGWALELLLIPPSGGNSLPNVDSKKGGVAAINIHLRHFHGDKNVASLIYYQQPLCKQRDQTSFLISTISKDERRTKDLGTGHWTGQDQTVSLVQLAGQVLAGCQVAAF